MASENPYYSGTEDYSYSASDNFDVPVENKQKK